MVTDWVLYTDVKSIETGLVYGPPDKSLIRALLTFSVIGTLTFLAQIAILLMEFKTLLGEKGSFQEFFYRSDLISLVTIILEDFPQAVITLTLVACREEGISYVQIAKAILPVTEILARIIVFIYKKRCDESETDETDTLVSALGWTRVIGLVVVFILNVAMLILTTTEKDVDIYGNSKSALKGRQFKYIFDEEYNDKRYLQDVGIYLHHQAFDYENSSSVNFVKLIELYDLEHADVADFRFLIDRETNSKFIFEKSTCRDPFPKKSKCFEKVDNNIKIISPCKNFFTNFTTFALRFVFKERHIPSLLLGDVSYNWKTDITGNCSQNLDSHTLVHSVRYYRSKEPVNRSHYLKWTMNGTRFFNVNDLIDARYFWKTSFSSCQSTGRTIPNVDKDISLNCAI